jgi:hypothetical protein
VLDMTRNPFFFLLAASLALGPVSAWAGKTDNLFTLESKATPDKLAPGAKGSVAIEIKVKPEGHISDEAPFKATLAAKNLQLAKDKLAKSDAVYKDRGATVSLPFTAGAEKGAASVDASLTFFICSKEICERHERKLSIPVTVQ